jgi:chorismate dehydratase
LLDGSVDLGLVPVAVIPLLGEKHIVSEYCIGAIGKVRSVMLYGDVPMQEMEKVLLDNQSRTSVMLTRVLAKHYWKIEPGWVAAKEGFEKEIGGASGGVVIGDRTFALENRFKYNYDLAEEWEKFTGLPFVFACWVANKPLPVSFMGLFNDALRYGLEKRDAVIQEIKRPPASREVITDYLHNSINYDLDREKMQAMERFLELIKTIS